MSEAGRTKRFLDKVRRAHPGAFVWKISDRVTGGIPDAMVVVNANVIWYEFKVGEPEQINRLVRPLQKRQIEKLREAGATIFVVLFKKAGVAIFDKASWTAPVWETWQGTGDDTLIQHLNGGRTGAVPL